MANDGKFPRVQDYFDGKFKTALAPFEGDGKDDSEMLNDRTRGHRLNTLSWNEKCTLALKRVLEQIGVLEYSMDRVARKC